MEAKKTRPNLWTMWRKRGCGGLLFEEILEGLAGVVGARRRCGGGDLGRLGVGSGGGVLFDGHAEFVELTIIFCVFRSDALGDGLRALELRARIEKAALLATVQLKLALRTLPAGVEASGQDGAAIGAATAGDGADHARSARAELVGARTTLRRFALMLISFFAFFCVAITAVTVLSIHKRLRPGTRPDMDYKKLKFRVDTHSNRDIYPNGMSHSAHSAIITQRFQTGLATSKQEMGHLCF